MNKEKESSVDKLKQVKEKKVSLDLKKEIDKKIANTVKPFNK